ncbi:hypothetical protein ScPMuIL_014839 [Solemya velum]
MEPLPTHQISSFSPGKEREYSMKLLFKFFCNNLYLGQWELARACLKQLHEESSLIDGSKITDILTDIAEYPNGRSVGFDTLRSPHQLAWLCMSECRTLQEKESGNRVSVDRLAEDVQFRLLLLEACAEKDSGILQELSEYYYGGHHKDLHIPTFSVALLTFLKQTLAANPLLGHNIVSAITFSDPTFKKNNEILQSLYVSTINDLLDNLLHPEVGKDSDLKIRDRVYELLAYFDPEQYGNYLVLRELFDRFLEITSSDGQLLNKNSIFSVLMGRDSCYLLDEFCNLSYDFETKKILSVCRKTLHGVDLDDDQKWILGVSEIADSSQRLGMMLMFCLRKKKHLLETILETGLNMIKLGHFDSLLHLVGPKELHPLKPLLLLLGWQYCYECSEARQLLDTLWDNQIFCRHPALSTGCNQLAYQIDLIQWCLDKTKPLVEMTKTSKVHHQRAADMFRGFENHSVLYVLHHATKLSSLNQQEVLSLLQKSPATQDSDGRKSRGKRKSKTVRFAVDNQIGDETAVPEVISVEQKRDSAIYIGFCAMTNVMDAIFFCLEYAHHELMSPIKTRFPPSRIRQMSHSSSSDNRGSASENEISDFAPPILLSYFSRQTTEEGTFPELYAKHVTGKLSVAKDYLSELQPITYRLEVLENIFSLLFVTHEDIQQTFLSAESDSEEGEVDEGSFHTSTSTEIFLQSLVSEESVSPTIDPNSSVFTDTDSTVLKGENSVITVLKGENSVITNTAYDEPFVEPSKTSSTNLNVPTSLKRQRSLQKENGVMKDVLEGKNETEKLLMHGKQSKDSTASRHDSGNTTSPGSLSSLLKIGFLASEYVVRDVLAMLKDCVLDLAAAKFQLQGSEMSSAGSPNNEVGKGKGKTKSEINPEIENQLCHLIKSSVENHSFQKRLATLTQHIHEAKWRFQLVCHELIPRQSGELLTEPVLETSGLQVEETHIDLRVLSGLRSKNRRRRYSSGRRLSLGLYFSETENLDTSHSDGMSSDGHSRRSTRARSQSVRGAMATGSSIVPLMLSSPETLLSMSIRKGNLGQAAQVIKLFKLDGLPEAKEVTFLQAYSKAAKRLQNLGRTGSLGSSSPVSNPGRLSMKALGNIAAVGMATVSVSNVTDELLSCDCLPVIPVLKTNVHVPHQVLETLSQDNCAAMVLFDLTCTVCKTYDLCCNVMDSIKIRRPQKTSIVPSAETMKSDSKRVKSSVKVRGFWELLDHLEQLLHVSADEKSSRFPVAIEMDLRSGKQKQSLQSYLQSCTLPLSADGCKAYWSFISNLTKSLEKVDVACRAVGMETGVMSPMTPSTPRTPTTPVLPPSPSLCSSPNSPGSPSFFRSKSHSESPIIHTAMKQLIHTLERDVPQGGIAVFLSSAKVCQTDCQNRNYLFSLYEHVKELAFLISESEAPSKETAIIPKNYFTVLEEGPIAILGRMMFSKRMQPIRLENVAKKLSLNLTHIIVHSCCPKIPSRSLQVLPPTSVWQKTELLRLPSEDGRGLDPKMVGEILTQLLQLIQSIADDHGGGVLNKKCTEILTKKTEYDDIIQSISKLKMVDLGMLQSWEEKLCFYGNLENLMSIHSRLHYIKLAKNKEMDREKEMGDRDLSISEELLQLIRFTYHVGQLGLVSLFDLRFVLNRCGLSPPSLWSGILEHRLFELDKSDPWSRYAPSPDPRLVFVTSSASVSSPPIQVLTPEKLREQLQSAMIKYLAETIGIDKAEKKVSVPELLMWYKRDFCSDSTEPGDEEFLQFLCNYLEEEKQQLLQELLMLDRTQSESGEEVLPFSLVNQPRFNSEFAISFDYSLIKKGIRPRKFIPRTLESLRMPSDLPTYHLTPVTLEYIKSDSPLAATLVSLVCSDELDNIEEHMSDDYFSEDLHRKRAASDISILDIRSYRYQKLTEDYPH